MKKKLFYYMYVSVLDSCVQYYFEDQISDCRFGLQSLPHATITCPEYFTYINRLGNCLNKYYTYSIQSD